MIVNANTYLKGMNSDIKKVIKDKIKALQLTTCKKPHNITKDIFRNLQVQDNILIIKRKLIPINIYIYIYNINRIIHFPS